MIFPATRRKRECPSTRRNRLARRRAAYEGFLRSGVLLVATGVPLVVSDMPRIDRRTPARRFRFGKA